MSSRHARSFARAATVLLLCAALLAAAAFSALAALNLVRERERFVTWEGIGPDKWSTVWLIRRHVDPAAPIEFVPAGTTIDRGIAFDVPDAALRRTASRTAFEQVVEAYAVSEPRIARLGAIINEIEISAWQIGAFTEAAQVEHAYRTLQRRHARERVPFPCYLAFFDRVHALLSDPALDLVASGPEALLPSEDCDLSRESPGAEPVLVPELTARSILARMARGENVVFVDTREDAEYAEGHIPGAVNLKLREVDPESARSLGRADLVVPYCVKDFRGFEVARALQKAGVRRVAIMNPYGIRGWRGLELPVAGTQALPAPAAARELEACVADVTACLRKP